MGEKKENVGIGEKELMIDKEKVLDIIMKSIYYYYDIELTNITRKEYQRICDNPDEKTIIKQLVEDGLKEEREVQRYIKENLK